MKTTTEINKTRVETKKSVNSTSYMRSAVLALQRRSVLAGWHAFEACGSCCGLLMWLYDFMGDAQSSSEVYLSLAAMLSKLTLSFNSLFSISIKPL